MSDLLVTDAFLVTNDPSRGEGPWGVIPDGAVHIADGRVAWVGPSSDVSLGVKESVETIDAGGGAVLPGFVDPHTHLVFAGDRAEEFARRMAGASYTEIMAAGGGIMSTVRATRAATTDDLYRQSRARAERMIAAGTTTVEIKSGYGLDVATERRMLEVVRRLDDDLPWDVVPTFLGAHVVPPEYADDRDGYLRLIETEMLPACAPLARFCDVFCDDGAFTVVEARRIVAAATRHGLRPKLHAEQLAATGAADLAAEIGAVSADHLDHVTADQARRLAAARTVAVLLPGAALSMRTPPPPVGLLRDAGVTIALATDCNPGTSYWETMPAMIALAVLNFGMSVEEAVWSATRGGALALALGDRGRLTPGDIGDLVVLDADHPAHLAYRPDTPLVRTVVKAGRVVAGR